MQEDILISEIVKRVLYRIKLMQKRSLIVLPRVRNEMSGALAAMIKGGHTHQAFDIALTEKLPEQALQKLQELGIQIVKQACSVNEIEFDCYQQIYVLDISPSVIREVSEIRPYSMAGQIITDALERNIPIFAYYGAGNCEELLTPFEKSLLEDMHRLRSWGVVLHAGLGSAVQIHGKVITVEKLFGYENASIQVAPGAVFTEMAKEKMIRDSIRVVE